MTETTTHVPAPFDAPPARRLSAELDAIEQFGPERFANRELSRLDFGSRLLDLAEDTTLPLLERVKFMAIFSELLDEFFQVRVAGLEDQVVGGVTMRSADGLRSYHGALRLVTATTRRLFFQLCA